MSSETQNVIEHVVVVALYFTPQALPPHNTPRITVLELMCKSPCARTRSRICVSPATTSRPVSIPSFSHGHRRETTSPPDSRVMEPAPLHGPSRWRPHGSPPGKFHPAMLTLWMRRVKKITRTLRCDMSIQLFLVFHVPAKCPRPTSSIDPPT